MEEINFFSEDIDFNLNDEEAIRTWLLEITTSNGYSLDTLNYIFCSDEYLLKINIEYLAHDTYTDIVTFDNSELAKTIEGDIFISIDRIKENSTELGTLLEEELHRVMAHGLLHLLGQGDKLPSEKIEMTSREDLCLDLRGQKLISTKRST
ncbi:MAG: rRNA maturation RNase YbeY [Cyclobacteriaceae bacterium]